MEVVLAVFIARVEFRFEADGVDAAGRRLHDLSTAAAAVGFEVKRGRVEPAPPKSDGGDDYGWTGYGPNRD